MSELSKLKYENLTDPRLAFDYYVFENMPFGLKGCQTQTNSQSNNCVKYIDDLFFI